jgi:large subunit ribosomal protein L16
MLAPKRIKFRKTFKGRTRGIATRGNTVAFGEFGLMSLDPGWITNRQIEASRVAMTREMKRGGKVWIRIFPDKPITKKPAETRMGKGKGNPEGWVAVVKPGRMMFEVEGISEPLARKALALAAAKLPVKTRFVARQEGCAMETSELREMSVDDLRGKLGELVEEQFRLRFRSATESIGNPMRFRALRRDIARIKTVLRQRASQGEG